VRNVQTAAGRTHRALLAWLLLLLLLIHCEVCCRRRGKLQWKSAARRGRAELCNVKKCV
jgi:hypothetical protein